MASSFARWSSDYNNASLKLESAAATLSEAERVKEDLEANVKDFRQVKMMEEFLCTQLASLQKKQKELVEQISTIKAQIETSVCQWKIAEG